MRIAFRVDANATIGTGHLMRCLALARALALRGATCCFATRNTPPQFINRITGAGHQAHQLRADTPHDPSATSVNIYDHWLGCSQEEDAQEFLDFLDARRLDWIVIDHYALGVRWHNLVRRKARRLLVIDDLANRPYDADLLLDQNIQPQEVNRYAGLIGAQCQLLLGPRYSLLRPEFCNVSPHKAATSTTPARDILICLGGTAPRECNERILSAMDGLPAVRVTLIANAADHASLRAVAPPNLTLLLLPHAENMAELMRSHDLAIGAGGSMTWERFSQGIPSLLLGIAQNQASVITHVLEQGLAFGHPDLNQLSQSQLRSLVDVSLFNVVARQWQSREGQRRVDGRGAERLAHVMLAQELHFRSAHVSDAVMLFEWRNNPIVRAASHSSTPIVYTSHLDWLKKTLTNPDRILLIARAGEVDIGVVRFDRKGQQATISIYLAPAQIGQGWGAALIKQGCEQMSARWPDVAVVEAEIQTGNIQSMRSFAAAGFQLYSQTMTWLRNPSHD